VCVCVSVCLYVCVCVGVACVYACVRVGYGVFFALLGFPGFFRGQVRHYGKGVIVLRVFFPWFLSVQKCQNRIMGAGDYSPEGFFFIWGFCLGEMCASVCLSVSTCVRVSVRVCDTGYFLHVFPGIFFPWTSATKALWEGGFFPNGFSQGFLSEEKCNNRTIGRGL